MNIRSIPSLCSDELPTALGYVFPMDVSISLSFSKAVTYLGLWPRRAERTRNSSVLREEAVRGTVGSLAADRCILALKRIICPQRLFCMLISDAISKHSEHSPARTDTTQILHKDFHIRGVEVARAISSNRKIQRPQCLPQG